MGGKLKIINNGVAVLEAFMTPYGSSVLVNDIDRNVNVKRGSESGSSTTEGGTVLVFLDGDR